MTTQELIIVSRDTDAFHETCTQRILSGASTLLLRPYNRFAESLAERLDTSGVQAPNLCVLHNEVERPLQWPVTLAEKDTKTDLVVVCASDPKTVAALLMDQVDDMDTSVVSPVTTDVYTHHPLFLISIPKSGTHLLYRLAEVLGYRPGVVCPDNPRPETWYCVEHSNSHTSARHFFNDTVSRSPFGNRDHPFMRSPALFIYRNPLDILVSEANYYHRDGKTAFAGYLQNRSFEERLLALIDDPWLLGSIRDRVGEFIAWLEFPNVIPVSFEELIGPRGGGASDLLARLIWSIQLKLQVPGQPETISSQLYREDSPTFHKGQIGEFRTEFPEAAMDRFFNLPQDFMELLGYACDPGGETPLFSGRIDEFRRRPLRFSETEFSDTPITVEQNFSRHNIVKYQDRFFVVPESPEPIDLTTIDPNRFFSTKSLQSSRNTIILGSWYRLMVKFLKRTFSGKT